MNALDFANGVPNTDLIDRIQGLMDQQRPRSRAAFKTSPTPPGQVAPISTSKLAFFPVNDPRIIGYVVYRSLTNNSATGMAVAFISQPTAVIGSQQIISDVLQVAGTYFYWAAAITAGGGESTRIGIGRQTK